MAIVPRRVRPIELPLPRVNQRSEKVGGSETAADGTDAGEKTSHRADEKSLDRADASQGSGQKSDSGAKPSDRAVADNVENAGASHDENADTSHQAGDQSDNSDTSGEPTDGDGNGDIIKIQADSMELDPKHARYHIGDGEAFLFTNSSVNAEVDLNSPATSLSIFARADKGGGEWPRMRVTVDGTPMGEVVVNSAEERKFYLPIYADPGHARIELTFVNDFYDPAAHQDRNLYISQIKIHTEPVR